MNPLRNAGRAPSGNASVIAAELIATRCRWCNDDLEHCHDELVVHATGERHCMAPDCTTPAELHHLTARCGDFGCTCASDEQLRAYGIA